MAQHNISYVQTLAKEGLDEEAKRPVADKSVVEIIHMDGKKAVIQGFTGPLSGAMEVFFGCQSYHTPILNCVEFTFYGIAANTAAAAMAFEMCFNLISHWAMQK
jgi:hypothetical protein